MSKQRILIELDCILDTRLGVVMRHFPDAVNPLMAADNGLAYYKRQTDDLESIIPIIDNTLFKEYYKYRDVEILRLSVITNVVTFLINLVKQIEVEMITSPVIEGVQIDINIYPYKLNEEEIVNIQHAFCNYIKYPTIVNMVDLNYNLLNVDYLSNSWDLVIMYNFVQWLSIIGKLPDGLNRHPSLIIRVPKLYYDCKSMPTTMDITQMGKMGYDAFSLTQKAAAEFFCLDYGDIYTFSVVDVNHII